MPPIPATSDRQVASSEAAVPVATFTEGTQMSFIRHFAVILTLAILTPAAVWAQAGSVSGQVVDATSMQPISGANVVVVGTQLGTLTGPDGRFQISNVPAGTHQLRASLIGYGPQEMSVTVAAGGTGTANFSLQPQAVMLEELVAVGYGTQRREAITGSVATVNAEEANVGQVTSPTELIEGRVSGVQIVQNDGGPGAGVQVRVRGGTSISASNEPLYVIDGVPINNTAVEPTSLGQNNSLGRNPLSLINPSDIESMTVLKDASATAIYGSRGANGVILITTKRGADGRTEMVYDTYVASSSPSRKLDVLSGEEYRRFVQGEISAGRLEPTRLDNLGNANTDWEDELLRTAVTQSHNLAFSGGTSGTRYRGSLNYLDQQGVVRSSGMERLSGRISADQDAFEGRLRLGLNLNATQVKNDYVAYENTGGFTGTAFTNMLIMNPTHPVMVTDPATGVESYYEIGPGAVTLPGQQRLKSGWSDRWRRLRSASGWSTCRLSSCSGRTARRRARCISTRPHTWHSCSWR